MKVFTLESGFPVSEGAFVTACLVSRDVTYPCILVGLNGPRQKMAALPVGGLQREGGGGYWGQLFHANVGTTLSGRKPKLFACPREEESDECIIVFRSWVPYRGKNEHTGDRTDVPCPKRGEVVRGHECYRCFLKAPDKRQRTWVHPAAGTVPSYAAFPGKILCEGTVAVGDGGLYGDGTQIIAVLPKNAVFRVGSTGRLPRDVQDGRYGCFDGRMLKSLTWKQRRQGGAW